MYWDHGMYWHHGMWGPHLWPFMIVAWVLWIVPLYRLLGRAGFSRGWAFAALFPPLGMVVLWVIAFARWPGMPDAIPPAH